jgi:hypothetical protein
VRLKYNLIEVYLNLSSKFWVLNIDPRAGEERASTQLGAPSQISFEDSVPVQCSAVQCNTVKTQCCIWSGTIFRFAGRRGGEGGAVQCSAVQCSAVQEARAEANAELEICP